MKVYKIRDKKTGEFYKAGIWDTNSKGKLWVGIGPLKSAITSVIQYYPSEESAREFLNCIEENILDIDIEITDQYTKKCKLIKGHSHL